MPACPLMFFDLSFESMTFRLLTKAWAHHRLLHSSKWSLAPYVNQADIFVSRVHIRLRRIVINAVINEMVAV